MKAPLLGCSKIFVFVFSQWKTPRRFIWGSVYFCTMDGFFRILKKTVSELICTWLYVSKTKRDVLIIIWLQIFAVWVNNIFLDPSQGGNPTTQKVLHDMAECKCGIMRCYSNCIWMLPEAIPIGFYFDFCGIAVGVIWYKVVCWEFIYCLALWL